TAIELNNSRIDSINSRLQENNVEGGTLEDSLKRLDEEIATRKDKEEYLNEQLAIYARKLSGFEGSMQDILGNLGEAEKKAEKIKLRIDELTESLYDKRLQARQTRGQIK